MKPLYKKIVLSGSLFFAALLNAQTEIKVNTLFAPVGIYNIAVEKPINNKISMQVEAFVSPWKSFNGRNLQIYMGTVEGRYYFKEKMKNWYVGTYVSMAAFNLQKWNYWKDKPVFDELGQPEILPDGSVRVTGRYQKGLAFIFGISGGYHFTINNNWGLDVYAGIGTTQSFYKGYFKDNGERYDGAKNFNKSGELIPTRGGLMLTYRIN
ncbi:hypothetical protein IQ37_06180 [Chryseobacterium piperi]|uniref:DUF3575 domain-containing protein n=1 Tax=Chryseobacterium piperi TaxID=558152 RepID=A0A086BKB9_9FLAO|nr:DUF3575 domain-containing protein [Chryseobacterium piperi]ASW76160.1 DUF3575 domain-containing protein [Chryseobacterium piperi]KFF29383.1 hypothetical protein IQ37_06180 [Chryseobacterium piperi]